MKLFRVRIDNNPGQWKSGEDPHVLVVAKDEKEAIQKVRDGWDGSWDFKNSPPSITYKKMNNKEFSYVTDKSELYASEIKFEGYDLHIKTERKAKLDRIEKHLNKND